MLRNPYLNRAMVRSVGEFHGRRRELERVMARLGAATPQSVSVVGERRSGKSSLLWHLAAEEVRARYLQRPEQYVFTLVDFQGQQHLDRAGFCGAFSRQLAAAAPQLELGEAGDLQGIERHVAAFAGAGLRLVCLLDEFEAVTRSEAFGIDFFGFLRSLVNGYPIAFVTATRRDLQSLCHTREISESPFFNVFAEVHLGPFSRSEALELIEAPSAAAGLPLGPHADRLLDLGGHLPFYLQMACSAAFECLVEAAAGSLDWRCVVERFEDEAAAHFRYLWEHFGADERALLALLAAGGAPTVDQAQAARRLAANGYLVRADGTDRVFSAPFCRYVSRVRGDEPAAETPPAAEAGEALRRRHPVAPAWKAGERPYPDMVGQSEAIRRVFTLIARTAASDVSVLLTGETGTGKELAARAIHENSARADRPFVVVNCGAVPESLQESELFGHVKGAFTGAVADRDGLFSAADGGVLFLDEIGDTAPSTQVRLLRALQEGEIRRVGEDRVRRVDVRLICATNRDLEEEIGAGRFRQDLYYRLYVLAIDLPPLRQRPGDIPLLVRHFLADDPVAVTPGAMAALQGSDWPGNIRELQNQIASARAMSGGAPIEPGHLWERIAAVADELSSPADTLPDGTDDVGLTLRDAREAFERQFLQGRLEACGWRLPEAAESLGVSRSRLYELLRRHGLRQE